MQESLRETIIDMVSDSTEPTLEQEINYCKSEAVNHPSHYGGESNPYEAIKVIEAHNLGFNLGNAVKYISRAYYKSNPLQDLKKARYYLDREITRRETKAA